MQIFKTFDQEGFRWSPMLGLSLLLHGVLFAIFFWVPGFNTSGLKMNEVPYEVTLADASNIPRGDESTPSVRQPEKSTTTDSRQARRISTTSSQKNTVNIPKRNARLVDPKPKKGEVSSDKLLDKTISDIEKKVKTENSADYLDKTIAELKKNVGSAEDGKAGGVSGDSLAINIYKMKVEAQIKNQWSYSTALGYYEAVVIVRIRKDGTVLETNFIKPSGNRIFDESVSKAIEKARPLPPLPEEYRENYEEIRITFSPKDL